MDPKSKCVSGCHKCLISQNSVVTQLSQIHPTCNVTGLVTTGTLRGTSACEFARRPRLRRLREILRGHVHGASAGNYRTVAHHGASTLAPLREDHRNRSHRARSGPTATRIRHRYKARRGLRRIDSVNPRLSARQSCGLLIRSDRMNSFHENRYSTYKTPHRVFDASTIRSAKYFRWIRLRQLDGH
jgi:hypothetical protein